jgi:hypothetical protein
MNWNHRVINCPSENGGDDYFTFKEVYYDDKDQQPYAYGNVFLGGDDLDELQTLVARLSTALTQPVLHERDFE